MKNKTQTNSFTNKLKSNFCKQFGACQIVFISLFFLNNTFSFAQINGGGLNSLTLCSNSTVMAWGYNNNGQLGIGDTNRQLSPVEVHGPLNVGFLTGVTALASGGDALAGVSHSLALKNDGTVWAWGWNHYGQLGTGDTNARNVPVQVSNLTNVTSIAGGGFHSYVLKSDGTVWAWGRNYHGELGIGDTISSKIPVQVHGPGNVGFLTNIIAIATGGWGHSFALKSDGTVWSWGQNYFGQLGVGDTTDRYSPTQVSITGITAISAGGGHSLALKNDGTVWAWGYNSLDQLGDSTSIDRHAPVQVHGPGSVAFLTGIIQISGGAAHNLALKNDGTVWAWGFNQFGQLGDGNSVNGIEPVPVSLLTSVYSVSAGGGHSMALKHDGTVWTWGYNTYGELGDGTTVEHSTPIQVNGLCAINGINELHNQQMNLDISPNPSSGVFNLQMSQFENLKMNNIEIYDVYGKKIYQSSDSQILKSTIDLSNEPKGMYFIRAISEDKIIGIGKLIVE